MLRVSDAVEPGTVWTWNAIGKASGAWQLSPDADESRKGFLLNHLISDELPHPDGDAEHRISNSDPITGPGRLVRRARAAAPRRRLMSRQKRSPQVAAIYRRRVAKARRMLAYFAGRKES